ncbi:MAG TPA: nucleotidyl transferase AbiEii/AbiGii toxin family protein [Smithellaceae bacterium]|nr:nucleotidyl transferase AbiEii/AbiGii toxin family protein [Smithellaceae bacterium]
MRDLTLHEQFELEILSRMQSGRLLDALVFTGGTMLRLCHGLDRYSVDLDFWAARAGMDWTTYAHKLGSHLSPHYQIVDAANKRFSLVVELKSAAYPRSLKIKIRKEVRPVKTETSIAYSSNSTVQVFMKTVALDDMMKSKIEAFLTRGEIRDAYDMEFLLKRGVPLEADGKIVKRLLAGLQKLGKKDYSVKLGSLLPSELRQYYRENGFRILTSKLAAKT